MEGQTELPYFRRLASILAEEDARGAVLPEPALRLRALELTEPSSVRVVILGQDPYPTPGHAHGLAFSVRPGVRPPPSLRNILGELRDDVGVEASEGDLSAWAERGVLLLNAVLTVRAGESNSHAGLGWEAFTDAVIDAVAQQTQRIVFLLWGAHAQRKAARIEAACGDHAMLATSHPSPLAAYRGFLGSRCFSRANELLAEAGRAPIDWRP